MILVVGEGCDGRIERLEACKKKGVEGTGLGRRRGTTRFSTDGR